MKKFAYIDSLRGIAILMVIMVHTLQEGVQLQSKTISLIIENICGRGVQLFFVASAFTLFVSTNNRFEKEQNRITNFFIRRLFRIAPMYYLGIFYYLWQNGSAGQQYWLGHSGDISSGNIISNFLFLHGLNPYWINSLVPGGWSITVEMMFYLFVPFLITRVNTLSKAVNLLISSFILSCCASFALTHLHLIAAQYLWECFLNIYFLNQFPVFACGIIAYFLVIKKDYQLKKWQILGLITIPIGAFILQDTRQLYVFVGIFFSLFLMFLSNNRWKIFVNPFFSFFGKISFSAYLVHFAVIYLLNHLNLLSFLPNKNLSYSIFNYCIWLGVVVSITSLFSIILYNTIELGAQKLGGKLIARNEQEHPKEVTRIPAFPNI